jgi:hypothetical protein
MAPAESWHRGSKGWAGGFDMDVNAHRPDPGTKKRTLERMRF